MCVPSTRDADVLRLLAQVADIKKRIGPRIKQARLAKKRPDGRPWTQGDLARALPGHVEPSSISRWENGKVRPQDPTLEAIADALDRDFSWFTASDPTTGTPDLIGALGNGQPELTEGERMILQVVREIRERLERLERDQSDEGS